MKKALEGDADTAHWLK